MQWNTLESIPDRHTTTDHSSIISQYNTRHNMTRHCAVLFRSNLSFLSYFLSLILLSFLSSYLPSLRPITLSSLLSSILTCLPTLLLSFSYPLYLSFYYPPSLVIFLPTSRTITSHYITILDWKPYKYDWIWIKNGFPSFLFLLQCIMLYSFRIFRPFVKLLNQI